MSPLDAATHKRRQIIMAIALAIIIPLLNTLLQKYGFPPLPPLSTPSAATTSTSAQTSDNGGGTIQNPFVRNCSACDPFGTCSTAALQTPPRTTFRTQRPHLFPIFRRHERQQRRIDRQHQRAATHAVAAANPQGTT